jgi:hypothetical protein
VQCELNSVKFQNSKHFAAKSKKSISFHLLRNSTRRRHKKSGKISCIFEILSESKYLSNYSHDLLLAVAWEVADHSTIGSENFAQDISCETTETNNPSSSGNQAILGLKFVSAKEIWESAYEVRTEHTNDAIAESAQQDGACASMLVQEEKRAQFK